MQPARSRQARAAAESALVRVVHHYGGVPDFVLLGGLVPDLLCDTSPFTHAGTTDIDVQVNLEVHAGSGNAPRLAGSGGPKDLYDLVFVLLHHGAGGPVSAVEAIRRVFPGEPLAATRTAVEEVAANFTSPDDTGCVVYAEQMLVDHPDLDWDQLAADAIAAIASYCRALLG